MVLSVGGDRMSTDTCTHSTDTGHKYTRTVRKMHNNKQQTTNMSHNRVSPKGCFIFAVNCLRVSLKNSASDKPGLADNNGTNDRIVMMAMKVMVVMTMYNVMMVIVVMVMALMMVKIAWSW